MNEFVGSQPTLRPDSLIHNSTLLPSTTQPLRWGPPPSHFVKLNVDAACDNHKCRTGLGAIIRNNQGIFMCATIEAIPGLIPVYAAEARAIWFGLSYCLKEGYKKVEVESDSLNVINTIKGGDWAFN